MTTSSIFFSDDVVIQICSHVSAFPFAAVVRAFDPDSGLIYLTTGVPLEKLAKVNSIIRGKVNLPQSLLTEQVCWSFV